MAGCARRSHKMKSDRVSQSPFPSVLLSHRTKLVLAYLAVYIIWGSTYFATSVIVREIPPLYAAGIRFSTAGVMLFVWNLLHGEPLPRGREWHAPVVIAIFVLALTNGSTSIACYLIPSSVVSLLNAMAPGWTVLLDLIFFRKESHRASQYVGILLGVAGMSLLVFSRGGASATSWVNPVGAVIAVAGSVFWSFGNLVGKDIHAPSSILMSSAVSMMIAGPLLLVVGSLTANASLFAVSAISLKSIAGLAYLIVFGTFCAFCSHCWLMRVEPPSRVATSTFVNPVVAMILGATLGREVLTAQMLLGAAIIFFSVFLIWKK